MANLVVNGNFDLPDSVWTTGVPTSWSRVGSGGILDFGTTNPRDTVPTSIIQFAYLEGVATLSQNIIFTTAGDYILSFWTTNNKSNYNSSMTTTVSVETIVSQTYNYINTNPWIYYSIPFSVNSSQLNVNKKLSFATTHGTVWLTGVSIVAVIPCFREGTLISCSLNDVETEAPIENLKDAPYLVKTLKHGFLPIHSIGKSLLHNPGNRDRIQNRLYKLSPLNYPEVYKPLYLTGCHGILVPSLTDEEKQAYKEKYENKLFVTDGHYRLFACLDERAEPYDTEGDFPIYHVALQSEDTLVNYGIYANGLLVESCPIWSLTEKHKHVELLGCQRRNQD